VEFDPGIGGSLDSRVHPDLIVSKESVNSGAPSLMILDVVSYFVTNIAIVIVTMIDVVGKLRLEEVVAAVFTIPLK
jgi:hypothetical protein